MKIAETSRVAGPATPLAGSAAPARGAAEDDARTRDRVRRAVLEHGPVTAVELAALVGLTASAVRRHLENLQAEGLIAEGRAPRSPHGRGRGRPARHFVLTSAGHASAASGYDDLAVAAMDYLEQSGGAAAVQRFAEAQVSRWEPRYRDAVEAAGEDLPARVTALAEALSDDGYAATTRRVELPESLAAAGISSLGTQLCQGHCPVQRVAAQFPQLCEAEAEAFSRLLGVHVQRLATLAHGEHVCTTHVPDAPVHAAVHATELQDTTAPQAKTLPHATTLHEHERTTR